MKKTLLVTAFGIALSACGGGSTTTIAPNTGELSTSTPQIGAATDSSDTTTDAQTTNLSAPAESVVTATTTPATKAIATSSGSLVVSNTFAFDTARTVDIDFDLEEARAHRASVTICTTFDPLGGPFDVDYDSCTVQGQLENGVFHHSMEVTNDIESVAAVVWFSDHSRQPVMRVFPVEHQTSNTTTKRNTLSTNSIPRIVWR